MKFQTSASQIESSFNLTTTLCEKTFYFVKVFFGKLWVTHDEIFTTCVVTMLPVACSQKSWRARYLCFPLIFHNKTFVIRLLPRLSNILYFWTFLVFWISPGAFFRHALLVFDFCENQKVFCFKQIFVIASCQKLFAWVFCFEKMCLKRLSLLHLVKHK